MKFNVKTISPMQFPEECVLEILGWRAEGNNVIVNTILTGGTSTDKFARTKETAIPKLQFEALGTAKLATPTEPEINIQALEYYLSQAHNLEFR